MSKILIIEDDNLLMKLYSTCLQSAGFGVEEVINGKDGLEKIMSGGYGLILLDVMLPGMDGLTILKEVKKGNNPVLPNGPIVVMTNLTGGPIEKEAKELGVAECVDKSKLTPEILTEKVKNYFH